MAPKLDTGADLTVIPEGLIAQLRISPKGRVWTRGYDGTYAQRALYYVRMVVEGFDVAAVRCVATNRTNVLVGRNVLNHFVAILDGKRLTFELRDPLRLVNIALGNSLLSTCPVGDADGSGDITVNETIQAVNNALNGC